MRLLSLELPREKFSQRIQKFCPIYTMLQKSLQQKLLSQALLKTLGITISFLVRLLSSTFLPGFLGWKTPFASSLQQPKASRTCIDKFSGTAVVFSRGKCSYVMIFIQF